MRVLIDIPSEQMQDLDRLRRKHRVPRTALIRKAISAYVDQERESQAQEAFGIWKDHPVDALTFERQLRQEWDR